jgi:hypothetical protein
MSGTMPLDPSTLDSPNPRTLDGREYPTHLRPYEQLDPEVLPLFGGSARTFDEVSLAIADPRIRAALPRWIASATWRGLIERTAGNAGRRGYVLTPRGRARA